MCNYSHTNLVLVMHFHYGYVCAYDCAFNASKFVVDQKILNCTGSMVCALKQINSFYSLQNSGVEHSACF